MEEKSEWSEIAALARNLEIKINGRKKTLTAKKLIASRELLIMLLEDAGKSGRLRSPLSLFVNLHKELERAEREIGDEMNPEYLSFLKIVLERVKEEKVSAEKRLGRMYEFRRMKNNEVM